VSKLTEINTEIFTEACEVLFFHVGNVCNVSYPVANNAKHSALRQGQENFILQDTTVVEES
jgi:hypothetical protein